MNVSATNSEAHTTSYKVVLPFYGYAALSFLLLCMLMLFSTEAFFGHYFHPKLLALTHIASLAWATMMILGAGYQLIPVLVEGPLYSERLAIVNFWVAAFGIPALVYSFWQFDVGWLMQLSSLIVLAVLVIFAVNATVSIWKANKPHVQIYFLLTAVLWLCLTAFLGVLLVFNFSHQVFSHSHLHYLRLHAHMGLIGWFLLLVLGVGSRLIPMFFISKYTNDKVLWLIFYLINIALILFLIDVYLSGITLRIYLYLVMILFAVGLFINFCYLSWKQRIRKAVEGPMQLVMVAVALFLLPIVTASILLTELVRNERSALLLTIMYGSLVFLGWISAIILGMTFKTLPFIVWNKVYQSSAGLRKTPTPKELFSERLFRWQSVLYLTGLLLFEAGLVTRTNLLLVVAGILLLLAAVCYNLNVWKLLLHKSKVVK